jgi:hypothetical protein
MATLENYEIPYPRPAVISEKDRKYLERMGEHRILSENEWFGLQRRITKEVMTILRNNPAVFSDPGFPRTTINEIFKREKILVTNLKRVWNPYDWKRSPKKNENGEYVEGIPIEYPVFSRKLSKGSYCGGPDAEYRFILVLDDPKEIRNIKLRRKRRERREQGIPRVWRECNHEFKSIHRDTGYCSDACKMKAYRRRKKER